MRAPAVLLALDSTGAPQMCVCVCVCVMCQQLRLPCQAFACLVPLCGTRQSPTASCRMVPGDGYGDGAGCSFRVSSQPPDTPKPCAIVRRCCCCSCKGERLQLLPLLLLQLCRPFVASIRAKGGDCNGLSAPCRRRSRAARCTSRARCSSSPVAQTVMTTCCGALRRAPPPPAPSGPRRWTQTLLLQRLARRRRARRPRHRARLTAALQRTTASQVRRHFLWPKGVAGLGLLQVSFFRHRGRPMVRRNQSSCAPHHPPCSSAPGRVQPRIMQLKLDSPNVRLQTMSTMAGMLEAMATMTMLAAWSGRVTLAPRQDATRRVGLLLRVRAMQCHLVYASLPAARGLCIHRLC